MQIVAPGAHGGHDVGLYLFAIVGGVNAGYDVYQEVHSGEHRLTDLDRKLDLQQATKTLWLDHREHLNTAMLNGDEQNSKNIYICHR